MSILPTWPIAAGALVIGLAVGAYADHKVMGARIDKMEAASAEQERVRQVQRATDERAAREKEQQWAARAGQIEQEKLDEINRIRSDSAAAIARLSNRPDRKPAPASGVPQTTATCTAATGAELAASDAIFLSRLAERADEQRAALQACYQWAETVTTNTPTPQP